VIFSSPPKQLVEERNTLTERVKEFDGEVLSIQSRIRTLNEEKERASERTQQLTLELSSATSTIADIEASKRELQLSLNVARQEKMDLQHSVGRALDRSGKTEEDANKHKQSFADANRRNRELLQQIDIISGEKRSLHDECQQLQKDIAELRATIEKFRVEKDRAQHTTGMMTHTSLLPLFHVILIHSYLGDAYREMEDLKKQSDQLKSLVRQVEDQRQRAQGQVAEATTQLNTTREYAILFFASFFRMLIDGFQLQ
jgi:chromosome segregation ATPase